MGSNWTIYSDLAPAAARKVWGELDQALADFQDEYPDIDVPWDLELVTKVPAAGGLSATRMSKPLRDRLQTARCVYMLNEPDPDLDRSPQQTALLRALLERAGASLVDWGGIDVGGGGPVETGDAVLGWLVKHECDLRLYQRLAPVEPAKGGAPAAQPPAGTGPAPSPDKSQEASPAETMSPAERILEIFYYAAQSPESAADLRVLIDRLAPDARAFLRHLAAHGVQGEATATATLGIKAPRLREILGDLARRFDELDVVVPGAEDGAAVAAPDDTGDSHTSED